MSRKFDLNIDEILEAWHVDDGIREVIANALDEKSLTNTADIEISEGSDGKWHIRDYGRGIKPENLKQDEDDEKTDNPDKVIGKFGVGLKDALATFHRNKVNVLIKSQYCDIGLEMSGKHGFDEIETLHAKISDPSDPKIEGTDVILDGCNEEQIEKGKSYFLKFSEDEVLEETKYGQVLKKGTEKAKIYIGGLKVAEEENFLFSYNITSTTKKIRDAMNRERSNVGRTAYSSRVKKIIQECESGKVAEKLVDDLEKVTLGQAHDEVNWKPVAEHACKILNTRKDVIFVSSLDLQRSRDLVDHAEDDGKEVVTVPMDIKHSIQGEEDIDGNKIREIQQFQKEWNESFDFDFIEKHELTADEKKIFDRCDEILDIIGGRPDPVKEIKVSETMRMKSLEGSISEVQGLWEGSENRIIIKRNQLKSLELFAGTLLHEAAHATSGADDVSREFESALTSFLGASAVNNLQNNL